MSVATMVVIAMMFVCVGIAIQGLPGILFSSAGLLWAIAALMASLRP